jgi:phosphohistidine phosphatase
VDLILWRHAEAEPGTPDIARALTKKGIKQAARMARWLKPYIPKDVKILVSPARRAQETAQALGMTYETLQELAPGNEPQDILAAIGWPAAGSGIVIVVGHSPALGQIAALLLTGTIADLDIKKGAVWWFANGGNSEEPQEEPQTVLLAAMSPKLLRDNTP